MIYCLFEMYLQCIYNYFSILGPSSDACWVTDTDPATMATADVPTEGDIIMTSL